MFAGRLESTGDRPETDDELSDDDSENGDNHGVNEWEKDHDSVNGMTTWTPPGPPPSLLDELYISVPTLAYL